MVLKGVVRSASFAQSLFKRLADARLGGPLAFEFQNSVPFSPAHAGCFFMPSNETRPFLFPEGKNPLLKMDFGDVVPLIKLVELHRYHQWGDLMELAPPWRYYFVARLQMDHGYVPDTVLDNVPDTPSGAFAVMHAAEVWMECVKGTVSGTHPPAL